VQFLLLADGPAETGANPSEQFLRAKRLGDVIIRARVQCANLVAFVISD